MTHDKSMNSGCAMPEYLRGVHHDLPTLSPDDYRQDRYGRPIHKDLDELAKEITAAIDANGGKLERYTIALNRFIFLERQAAIFSGGGSVCADIGHMNFIWRGVPVVPTHPGKLP